MLSECYGNFLAFFILFAQFAYQLFLMTKHIFDRLCSTENRTTISKIRVISENVRVINEPFH